MTEPAPSPREEAASAASFAGSSTSEPFVGDTGPGFAASERPAQPGPELDAMPTIEWLPEQLRTLLANLGDGAHAIGGVGENDWRLLDPDLDRIVPPATRIANRHDVTRAAAAMGDEVALGIGMTLYVWRSILERKAVLDAQKADEEGPETTVVPPAPVPRRPPGPSPAQPGPPPGPSAPNPPGVVPPTDGLPAMPEDYVPQAERLRRTMPPDQPEEE